MQNFIQQLNNTYLYKQFLALLKFLENDLGWYIASIALFIVLVTVDNSLTKKIAALTAKKEKNKKLEITQKIIKILSFLVLIVVLLVSYNRFVGPTLSSMFKSDGTTPTNNTTTPSGNTTPNTKTTPTTPNTQATPSTPTYQAPKQLYYSVSCSSCWATGCPRNGYNYGGYQEYYYIYYKSLCQACSCNDYKAQSLWR